MKLKCLAGFHESNGVRYGYTFTDKQTTNCKYCGKELYWHNGKVKAMNRKAKEEIDLAKSEWRNLDEDIKEEFKKEASKNSII